jgi:hypothetical protein
MKKSIIIIALCALVASAFAQPSAKPDSLKWNLKFESTQDRNVFIHRLDTTIVTVNNSDIPSKDRVKLVAYLQSLMQFMYGQFQTQNQPAEPPKKK